MIHHAARLAFGLVAAAGKGIAVGVHHLAAAKAAHSVPAHFAATAAPATGTTALAGFPSAFTLAHLGQIHAATVSKPSITALIRDVFTTKLGEGTVGAVALGALVKGYLEEAEKEHDGVKVEVHVNEATVLLEMARQAVLEQLHELGISDDDERVVQLNAEARRRQGRLPQQFGEGPAAATA
jgi:hypothetical protein